MKRRREGSLHLESQRLWQGLSRPVGTESPGSSPSSSNTPPTLARLLLVLVPTLALLGVLRVEAGVEVEVEVEVGNGGSLHGHAAGYVRIGHPMHTIRPPAA